MTKNVHYRRNRRWHEFSTARQPLAAARLAKVEKLSTSCGLLLWLQCEVPALLSPANQVAQQSRPRPRAWKITDGWNVGS